MARGRFLSDSIATDKRLNSLSIEGELVYLMTIPHLDRDGLILGEPLALWGEVCRRRPQLMDSMSDIINEWVDSGLVVRYEGNDDPILFFVGFSKNQQGMRYDREASSQFPCPPGYARTPLGLVPKVGDIESATQFPTNSGVSTEFVGSDDGIDTAEVKGEVKGEVKDQGEGEVKGRHESAAAESIPPSLLIFHEFCTKSINRTQTDAITTAITDLGLWRQVLTEWSLRGYNTGNVNGLLDWYRDGIPPSTKNGINHGSSAKRNQSDNADDAPKLDPELQRKFAEHRERKRTDNPSSP